MIGAVWSDKSKVENQQHILPRDNFQKGMQAAKVIGQGEIWGVVANC